MSLIQFTVNYDLLAIATDSSDSGVNADQLPLIGEVEFTARFNDRRAILAADYSPRPTGFKILPITGYIDSSGRLKSSRSGAVGVRLPANDPVLGLDDPLVYEVNFRLTTPIGERVYVDGGYFAAPSSDTTIQLAEVLQTSVSSVASAPRISEGYFNANGDVVLENSDGSALPPIPIPLGYLVFVDNNDSTWSVG